MKISPISETLINNKEFLPTHIKQPNYHAPNYIWDKIKQKLDNIKEDLTCIKEENFFYIVFKMKKSTDFKKINFKNFLIYAIKYNSCYKLPIFELEKASTNNIGISLILGNKEKFKNSYKSIINYFFNEFVINNVAENIIYPAIHKHNEKTITCFNINLIPRFYNILILTFFLHKRTDLYNKFLIEPIINKINNPYKEDNNGLIK